VLKEATCREPGEGILSCSRCDYSESCTYAQTPHNYLVESSQSSTCNRPGWTLFICVDCGSQSMLQYGVTNHSWQYYSSTKKICSYCGWIVPSGGRTLF
jgi:hypothetical protein